MITKNIGSTDRIIRLVAGAALFVAAYTTGGIAAIVLAIAGAAALATGLIGWCGLYTLLGISTTCKIDKP